MTGIYVAFRRTAPAGAAWWQRALCALVRWRLVSQWCHAGVICDGVLHHVTATDGLTSTDDWTPARWELFSLPDSARAVLQAALQAHAGARYDWFSLLAFLLPWRVSDRKRLYCFEWCALVMGLPVAGRITPELLLAANNKKQGGAA